MNITKVKSQSKEGPQQYATKETRVLFLHGLESGPHGHKPKILRKLFTANVPSMLPFTRRMLRSGPHIYMLVFLAASSVISTLYFLYRGHATGNWFSYLGYITGTVGVDLAAYWVLVKRAVQECIDKSVALNAKVIEEFQPEVVVGSSFGGAIAVHLLLRGIWNGPTVLLAPAPKKMSQKGKLPLKEFKLPHGIPITIVHGTGDTVVPLADSKDLVAEADQKNVVLHVVDDGHTLTKHLTEVNFAKYIDETLGRSKAQNN